MDKNIKHRTEKISGLFRNEIYQLNDIEYVEMFDDLTGNRISGNVSMFNGIHICVVGQDGTLSMNFPTGWVFGHKEMMILIEDIKRLDSFLSEVCENYNK